MPASTTHFRGSTLLGDSTPKYASAPMAISTTMMAHPYVIRNSRAAWPFLLFRILTD